MEFYVTVWQPKLYILSVKHSVDSDCEVMCLLWWFPLNLIYSYWKIGIQIIGASHGHISDYKVHKWRIYKAELKSSYGDSLVHGSLGKALGWSAIWPAFSWVFFWILGLSYINYMNVWHWLAACTNMAESTGILPGTSGRTEVGKGQASLAPRVPRDVSHKTGISGC